MPTYNIIGDIHGRDAWKRLVDDDCINVFVGDYFDPYRFFPFEEMERNFLEITEYKKEHPNKVVLLYGNHDASYLPDTDDLTNRYDQKNAIRIKELFNITKDLFEGVAYAIGNEYLITHAGVTSVWKNTYLPEITDTNPTSMAAAINELWDKEKRPFAFMPNYYGKDFYGEFYRNSLIERGTVGHLFTSATLPSGVASTFISADGERTFGTYLGAALSLSADELSLDLFQGYTYLFIEGYLVQNHALIKRAMELAKEAGVKICIDLASYNIVKEDHEFFSFLVEKYVDIVFANEEEAKAFTGMKPTEAVREIAKWCDIAIVKIGAKGSLIGTRQEVIDTTGAGDYFAAGFLYGMVNHLSLRQCAEIGSIVGAEVGQVIGTELSEEKWIEIKHKIAEI